MTSEQIVMALFGYAPDMVPTFTSDGETYWSPVDVEYEIDGGITFRIEPVPPAPSREQTQ